MRIAKKDWYIRKPKIRSIDQLRFFDFGYWNLIPKRHLIKRDYKKPLVNIPKRKERIRITHIDLFGVQ